jgi:hypothetical protein
MRQHRIRVFMSVSYWNDIVISADSWSAAESIGRGMSPIGRAQYLSEAYA